MFHFRNGQRPCNVADLFENKGAAFNRHGAEQNRDCSSLIFGNILAIARAEIGFDGIQ